jgi:hypothetical protein
MAKLNRLVNHDSYEGESGLRSSALGACSVRRYREIWGYGSKVLIVCHRERQTEVQLQSYNLKVVCSIHTSRIIFFPLALFPPSTLKQPPPQHNPATPSANLILESINASQFHRRNMGEHA